MDRLELMEQFVRIVEARSLSGAARALRCGEPTVSKRLMRLEQAVGVRLMQRSPHGVRLTEVGERYFAACKRLLEELHDAEEEAKGLRRDLSGALRLVFPVTLGEVHLARMAVDFTRRHWGLHLEVVLRDGWVDLVAARADLAVRVGAVLDPSVVARNLGGYRHVLVAAPSYLERVGAPQTLTELSAHEYLLHEGEAEESFATPEGARSVKVHGSLSFNNSLAMKTAAVEGAGICRMPGWLVEAELSSGKLVELLPGSAPEPVPVFAAYLPSRFPTEKVRRVIHFLADALPRLPGWIPPGKPTAPLGGRWELLASGDPAGLPLR
jgi:DNA-binding transcriptional LysR family regulator